MLLEYEVFMCALSLHRQPIEQCRESKLFMWSLGPPHDMLSFTELIHGERGPKSELDN